jgi:Leucine-rich repeat (LRR) protein
MTSGHVIGVLDLTFLEISEEIDFQNGLAQRIPTNGLNTSTDLSASGGKKKKNEVFKAVRLANNSIARIELAGICLSKNIDLSKLLWIDLSFNMISKIPDDLSQIFPNLTTLYLHANQISKLSELKKLGTLTKLKSLSVYGNPVEENKHYRNYVMYVCSKLSQFDMSPVTKSELQKVYYTFILLLLSFSF